MLNVPRIHFALQHRRDRYHPCEETFDKIEKLFNMEQRLEISNESATCREIFILQFRSHEDI